VRVGVVWVGRSIAVTATHLKKEDALGVLDDGRCVRREEVLNGVFGSQVRERVHPLNLIHQVS
jgi:hypothetical protein